MRCIQLTCLLAALSLLLEGTDGALSNGTGTTLHSLSPVSPQWWGAVCRFTLRNYAFDICPLTATTSSAIDEGSSKIARTYIGGFRGWYGIVAFTDTGHLVADDSLSDDTWIYMKVQRPSSRYQKQREWIPVTIARLSEPFFVELLDASLPVLSLFFQGDHLDGQQQSAQIQLFCDSSALEKSLPQPAGVANGVHTFIWRTKHACGRLVPDSSHDPFIASAADTDSPETPAGENTDTGLRDNFPHSSGQRLATLLAVILSGSGLSALCYLLYASPRVRSLLERCARPMRFRVGESRLVHWVQEDLALLGVGASALDDGIALAEEDVMINQPRAHRAPEEIPLKPSPRYGALRQQRYGATA